MVWQLRKRHPKGEKGEKSALCHLKKQGLKLISANFSCRFGELDLVMEESTTLVFIEVRSRSPSRFGSASNSITPAKISKIQKTAAHFLQLHPQYNHWLCRFDTVAITINDDSKQNRLEWIKGAF